MGGSVLAGGWDLAKGRAKPLRRAIPAGSVFVVEDLGGGSPADLDGTCLSDFDQERLAAQGFGLVAAGIDS
jgi:CRISPR/Cas system CMR-associated protein Cmr3 (group 5 of RAMP superfamily)